MHRFRKDFFVFFSDGRNRISNNRKTAFLPVNVMIDQLALLAALIHIDFPLFVGIGNALLFLLRRKRLCPKISITAGPCHTFGAISLCLSQTVRSTSRPPLNQSLIQPQSAILLMIVHILFIQRNGIRAQHRLQSNLFKIVDSRAYHPLKSDRIADFHNRFFVISLPVVSNPMRYPSVKVSAIACTCCLVRDCKKCADSVSSFPI